VSFQSFFRTQLQRLGLVLPGREKSGLKEESAASTEEHHHGDQRGREGRREEKKNRASERRRRHKTKTYFPRSKGYGSQIEQETSSSSQSEKSKM
jgi:hypothetical protein